ncbi:DUF2721 domain-containing protein, partial [Aliarcobacter butzleri]|uniref:DUF2721 domain-containing protein n=1 Tax=Aliarcobacter butzleri TaxID=28197 RepID=UPI003B21C34B
MQPSVAPVFLLAGLAGLLNVFTPRLSRIIDKIDRLAKFEKENESLNDGLILSEKIKQRRKSLTMRMSNTHLAISFGTP